MNLSNEVLNIDFGQGATKILEVKVGGKKNAVTAWFEPMRPDVGQVGRYFFYL